MAGRKLIRIHDTVSYRVTTGLRTASPPSCPTLAAVPPAGVVGHAAPASRKASAGLSA